MLRFFIIAHLIFVSQTSFARSNERTPSSKNFGSKSIGHILSPNTETLNSDEFSIGTLYMGYGLTENLSIGASPFAYLVFDMASLLIRGAWDLSKKNRLSIEYSYYKTLKNEYGEPETSSDSFEGFNYFKMEASFFKASYSSLITPSYRLSLTSGFFYYNDDERPFSIRMDPSNGDPYAISLTSLHEFKLAPSIFINGELGFFGLNYQYPYYHAGLTLNVQKDNVLLGIGGSATFSPSFPKSQLRYFAGYNSRASIHPEFQIQLFF